MLTEYEAPTLAKRGATAGDPASGKAAPQHNRIGAVLVALSMLSAAGLLYAAFFSDRGQVSRVPQAAPAATTTTPVIHPATSGFPEAALFLRHRPLEGDRTVSVL